jgi:hypothetical protein
MGEEQLWNESAEWNESFEWTEDAPWIEDNPTVPDEPNSPSTPLFGELSASIIPYVHAATILDDAFTAAFVATLDPMETDMSSEFITGDSRSKYVQLTINGDPFIIPPDSSLSAQIVNKTKAKALSSASVVLSATRPGVDWAASLVAVKFPRASTADIKVPGKSLDAFLEVQVTLAPEGDAEDLTFYVPITLVKGNLP